MSPISQRPPLPIELLDRYLAGEATADEAKVVRAWLGDADEGERTRRGTVRAAWDANAAVQRMREGIGRMGAEPGLCETPQVGGRSRGGLGKRTLRGGILKVPRKHQVRFQPYERLAHWRRVMILASASFGLIMVMLLRWRVDMSHSPRAIPTLYTCIARAGQRVKVTLAPGTTAILGPTTMLRLMIDPHTQERVAFVHGEVLFTVTHGVHAPFSVRTENTIMHVLGTSFIVRRYASDRTTRVVVSEGRVMVQAVMGHGNAANASRITLAARDMAEVGDSGQVRVVPRVTLEEYTAWTTGRLIFRDAAVADVITALERAYAVEIHVTDSALARSHITWTARTAQLSLADVLREFALVLDGHVIQHGQVITIAPGRRASPSSPGPRLPLTQESQYGR